MSSASLTPVVVELGRCEVNNVNNVSTMNWVPQVPYKGASYPVNLNQGHFKPTQPVKHRFNPSKRKQYETAMVQFRQSNAIYEKLKYVIDQAKRNDAYGRHINNNKYEINSLGIEVAFSVDINNLKYYGNQPTNIGLTANGVARVDELYQKFKALARNQANANALQVSHPKPPGR